ncbi:Methyltransferase type 11 domain protein [Rhodopirellula maiorica SM1]|uniref:Methyltransferase type 11 domain protein n=1 Tax=Rhodopirellula maiorica SM1 TaxID=1265738 RepID=M5RKW4_9BACT|nr:class I SAM-dependent methyltransferase [Rhodopirellula maiorica]EMI19811.1 Methyltransferase type 11 domain protein [Rhodopirellula maiorica SM1]
MSQSIPSVSGNPSRRADLRVLWHLLFHRVRGATHAERLESFYGGQATDYDSFRERMLHGRKELISWIDFPDDGVWLDIGAGTGTNLSFAGDQTKKLRSVHLLDLSPSLLSVADQRIRESGFDNAQTHLADATTFSLPPESVDVITLSYSLTMIPDWFQTLALAEAMLKPGGTISVVDFYVSRKHASTGHRQHSWLRRAFWSHWFAADNVFLTSDHLAMLHRRFPVGRCEERFGKVPYLPLLRAPYYLYLGRKPSS